MRYLSVSAFGQLKAQGNHYRADLYHYEFKVISVKWNLNPYHPTRFFQSLLLPAVIISNQHSLASYYPYYSLQFSAGNLIF